MRVRRKEREMIIDKEGEQGVMTSTATERERERERERESKQARAKEQALVDIDKHYRC